MKEEKTKSKKTLSLLFSILFLFIFNFVSVSAEVDGIGYVRTNSCVALKQSYGNTTFQNITAVTLPDKVTIITINSAMQSLGQGLYNYTFCNTTQNGQYIVDGIGGVDGVSTTWTYDFYATPLGIPNTYIFYLIFILIISLIFIIGFKLENSWVMSLGSFLVLILGFFVIKNGVDFIKDVQTTWAIGLVVWALGIYFMFLSVEEQLKNWDKVK